MTTPLSEKVAELVGLGAAIAAMCPPCLSYHLRRAREVGAAEDEIRAALRIGRATRETPARIIDRLADRLAGTGFLPEAAPASCCEQEPVPARDAALEPVAAAPARSCCG